jgi:hypothetical protein
MKITEKQLLMLYQVLMDTLSIFDGRYSSFKYPQEIRRLLANDIIDQQSETLVKISEVTNLDKFICVFCGSSEGNPLELPVKPGISCCDICYGRQELKKHGEF